MAIIDCLRSIEAPLLICKLYLPAGLGDEAWIPTHQLLREELVRLIHLILVHKLASCRVEVHKLILAKCSVNPHMLSKKLLHAWVSEQVWVHWSLL